MPIGCLTIQEIIINEIDFTRVDGIMFKKDKEGYNLPISLKITCYGEFLDIISSTRVKRLNAPAFNKLNKSSKAGSKAPLIWDEREIPKLHTPVSSV